LERDCAEVVTDRQKASPTSKRRIPKRQNRDESPKKMPTEFSVRISSLWVERSLQNFRASTGEGQ